MPLLYYCLAERWADNILIVRNLVEDESKAEAQMEFLKSHFPDAEEIILHKALPAGGKTAPQTPAAAASRSKESSAAKESAATAVAAAAGTGGGTAGGGVHSHGIAPRG